MSRWTTLALLFLMPWTTSASSQPTASADSEVRAAVEAFGRAFVAADVSALAALLTKDYIHINGSSGNVIERQAWLAWIGSRRAELDSGVLVISDYEIKDMRIQLYGEVAIVTGIATMRGVRREEPFDTQVRFSNVWVRGDGAWRRAAFHDTPLR